MTSKPQFISPLTRTHFSQNNQQQTTNKKSTKRGEGDPSSRERNEKKRAKLEAEENEEKRLTSLLFGNDVSGDHSAAAAWHDDDDDDNGSNLESQDDEIENSKGGGILFQIDREGVSVDRVDEHDDDSQEGMSDEEEYDEDQEGTQVKGQASAWIDEDDEKLTISLQKMDRVKKLRSTMAEDLIKGSTYEEKLRERYQSTMAVTSRTDWARLPHSDDESSSGSDSEENVTASKLLSSTAPLLSNSRLQPNILSTVRCPDANVGHYNNSTLNAVHFHPGSDEDEPLLLTAGLDKTLRFFKINGTEGSEKVHGVHFPHLPIHSASFLGSTGSVIVSGRRSFFYIYDTVAGKIDKIPRIQGRKEKSLEKFTTSPDGNLIAFIGNDGYIILVEAKSKLWVADLKMNGSARAVSFSPDGDFIFASGSDGDVYTWDIRTKKCVDRFHNDDGTISSFLSVSNKFVAVGAESGVVNIYNSTSRPFQNRSPLKSIMNLQTSVDHMRFNPNGDILAMSSRREKDSLKLIHMPTQTVFSNWPTSKTPLSYVWSLDFSPASKFMAIGNDKGRCLLYKLSHYDS